MQERTSYFCHSTSCARLKWAEFLSEGKEKNFNNHYHHHHHHPGEARSCRENDQYGGDIFFDEGDNCISSYEEEPKEGFLGARNPTKRQDSQPHKRLLVVAHRLPAYVIRKDEESWQLEIRVGGLVSALLGLKDFEVRWIGWAGVIVPDEVGQRSLTEALAEKRCIPVFLDGETVNQFYNGYCNNILWPLLHYLGLPQDDRDATGHDYESQFDGYRRSNQMFADIVCKHYKDGDIVWCHDYHLMLLPQYLKEYNRKMKVGWFLHTPFPPAEILQTLPSRTVLLRSILAADIVGFQTFDYARHFIAACARILGLEGTSEGVEDQGKLTKIMVFPMGIDSDRFIGALELPRVQYHVKELRDIFAGRKVMLGVDRLDQIKGIPQKILAFEKFLEENPDWHDKVVLLQIAVPTKTDIPECQKLARQVHEMVARINGKFGTLSTVPIHHLDRSLGFHALCALYAVTDVALVTSLRDGMNLVSYEFVACQDSKKGVLILSEFAGAAQSLGAGAILVNPWNTSEVASSIAYALKMPSQEREKRHRLNFMHVTSHTAHKWAEMFVSELNGTEVGAQRRTTEVRPSLPVNVAVENYSKSNNRLLILGYNATLTQSVKAPDGRSDQIKELELTLHPELCEPLRKISDDPKTTVIVLSGSKRRVLDENLGTYNLWLAAENGMFLRHAKGDWITILPESLNMDCVDILKNVFEYFTERTPRSHFEIRETSFLWNYKYADVEFGRLQARILLDHLRNGRTSNSAIDVLQGSWSIEVRPVGVTKGMGINRILGEIAENKGVDSPITYVLCIGHLFEKDEDVYSFFKPRPHNDQEVTPRSRAIDAVRAAIPSIKTAGNVRGSLLLNLKTENYFSCNIGRNHSNARYLLDSSEDVVMLLKELAGVSHEP